MDTIHLLHDTHIGPFRGFDDVFAKYRHVGHEQSRGGCERTVRRTRRVQGSTAHDMMNRRRKPNGCYYSCHYNCDLFRGARI